MRLTAISPILGEGFEAEVEKETATWIPHDVELDVRSVRYGVESIECEYDEVLCAPPILEQVEMAVAAGTDGVFVSCFADPAVAAARERVDVPVVGGFEPPVLTALSLGERVGIVTVLPNVVPTIRASIRRHGLAERCSSIRVVDMPVLGLADRETMLVRLHEQARAAIDGDEADVIVLGCTGMSGAAAELQQRLATSGPTVPVVDPTGAAIGWLLHLARLGVTSSRATYLPPPDKKRVPANGR
ncbi:aspartate/glutamate racemase family protein [Phytoactinopolyspora halophila]|uniref:aspartate/glutamate racemase family protein n=1 Tax=Phytoactinopolyspora halophila TaxID=1981511 RepID=UPI001B8B757E|nr:aspartate/glutamate racemase family protein [Phytoactinopolyspora halophila]